MGYPVVTFQVRLGVLEESRPGSTAGHTRPNSPGMPSGATRSQRTQNISGQTPTWPNRLEYDSQAAYPATCGFPTIKSSPGSSYGNPLAPRQLRFFSAELSTPQVCHAKAKLGVLWPEVLQQHCQRRVGQLGSLPIQALGQVIMAIGAMLRA